MVSATAPNPIAKLNKWWLVGGSVAFAGVVYEYRKAKKKTAAVTAASATSAAAAAASSNAANAGNGLNGIDPSTGLPYNTSQDLYSGAQGSAMGSPYGALGSLTFNPTTGQYQASPNYNTPTTNVQWVQQAQNYLSSLGFDSQAIAQALGNYINGTGLSDTQMSIIQAATAAFGTPPVAVPAPTVASPNGQSIDTADKLSGALTNSAFYSTNGNGNSADLSKGPGIYAVSNGTRYHVTSTSWANINPKPPVTSTDVSSSIFSLPYGGLL